MLTRPKLNSKQLCVHYHYYQILIPTLKLSDPCSDKAQAILSYDFSTVRCKMLLHEAQMCNSKHFS